MLSIAIYFAFNRYGKTNPGWLICLAFFVMTGFVLTGISLIGTKWVSGKIGLLDAITAHLPNWLRNLDEVRGGLHPNMIAGVLLWILPLLMTIAIACLCSALRKPIPEDTRRDFQSRATYFGLAILIGMAAILVFGVFLLTQSRAGYLGLGTTLIVLLWLALPSFWRKIYTGVLGLIIIFGGLLIWKASPDLFSKIFFDRVTYGSSITTVSSMEMRLEIWSRAIYGIQDFPITGMGMNTFSDVAPMLYPLFFLGPDEPIFHAHNEFLQTTLDLGIPGLIAFLALYLGSFRMLGEDLKTIRHNKVKTTREQVVFLPLSALVLGLTGGLFGHMLYSLLDANTLGSKAGVMFWMLLGLISSLHSRFRSLYTWQD